MKYTAASLLVLISLGGCSGSPPKPAAPEGEYHPINVSASVKHEVFDFNYDGDVIGVLPALRKVAPMVSVMPTTGTPIHRPIHVHLRATTLDNALRVIGLQCGDAAQVIWRKAKLPSGDANQVSLRFL